MVFKGLAVVLYAAASHRLLHSFQVYADVWNAHRFQKVQCKERNLGKHLGMYAFWLADKNILPYTYTLCLSAEDTAAIADIKTACDTLVATETLKFVTNVRPIEEFDDFVAELKKLGAEKIEEIYQKAYLNSLK